MFYFFDFCVEFFCNLAAIDNLSNEPTLDKLPNNSTQKSKKQNIDMFTVIII